jgi:hypothetical protein
MAAAERILTPRELNRALLARQLLLERGRMTLPRALERIGGLQAQYAPSMYIGLWTRLEGFARDDLTRALERRSVVQGTLMRTTIHLVSAADYWPFALATRSARRESWLRSTTDGLSARELAGAARRLRPRLAGGPLRRADVEALLGKDRARGVGGWIDLVRAPPSGTWERRRADLWALAEDWLGPPETTAREGVELLVRHYLRAFGPASGTTSPTGPACPYPSSRRWSPAWRRAAFAPATEPSSSTCPACRCPTPRPRRRCATCRGGTRPCSSTPAGPASCPRSTGRGSSPYGAPSRIRCSWSTARWPARGPSRTGVSGSSRSIGSMPARAAPSRRRASGWPRSADEQ